MIPKKDPTALVFMPHLSALRPRLFQHLQVLEVPRRGRCLSLRVKMREEQKYKKMKKKTIFKMERKSEESHTRRHDDSPFLARSYPPIVECASTRTFRASPGDREAGEGRMHSLHDRSSVVVRLVSRGAAHSTSKRGVTSAVVSEETS